MFRFFQAIIHFFESSTLKTLAEDAVAIALAMPGVATSKYADLLRAVVQILSTSSSVKDQGALERAAAGALLRAGYKPDGK